MRGKRRNHSSAFKAKVALAVIKGDRTLADLAEQFSVHPNQIQEWRKRLIENVGSLFGRGQRQQEEVAGEVKDLHATIRQLTMYSRSAKKDDRPAERLACDAPVPLTVSLSLLGLLSTEGSVWRGPEANATYR